MTDQVSIANFAKVVKSKTFEMQPPAVSILEVPPYLSIPQACFYFGLKTRWVYQHIWSGQLKAAKIGKEWRIPTQAIVQYLRKRTTKCQTMEAAA